MTTIACDGRSISGDGILTDDNVVCSTDALKVRRLKDGRLVGFAGNAFNYDSWAKWLDSNEEGTPPKATDGLACIVLHPDGSLFTYDENGRSFNEKDKWAIGSGQRFAIAAMDLGKTAEEAVSYACTRDIFSGGVVTTLHLDLPVQLRSAA